MKYYLDTEFLEGTQKEKFPISLFRKNTPPTIDLISIGIVSEDNREYYAISKDFNLKEAWNRFDLKSNKMYPMGPMDLKEYWIRENVLKSIFNDLMDLYQKEYLRTLETENFIGTIMDQSFSYKLLKFLINRYGKTNKEIAKEIIEFTEPMYRNYSLEGETRFTHGSFGFGLDKPTQEEIENHSFQFNYPNTNPEFYAYYADYDWVAFCWLFGKMMDLPTGYPMYCKDLKQRFDEVQYRWFSMSNEYRLEVSKSLKLYSVEINIKNLSNYPKQENEHNALADARWNKQLHEFLNKL